MLTNLRGQVVALAISAAQRLIGESLKYDEDHQHTLLKEFFSGVKDGRVLVIKDVDMKADASSAEVTSALPLTDEEKETVKQDFCAVWVRAPRSLFGLTHRYWAAW